MCIVNHITWITRTSSDSVSVTTLSVFWPVGHRSESSYAMTVFGGPESVQNTCVVLQIITYILIMRRTSSITGWYNRLSVISMTEDLTSLKLYNNHGQQFLFTKHVKNILTLLTCLVTCAATYKWTMTEVGSSKDNIKQSSNLFWFLDDE